jgi:DNA mismatch repair ATPase MutL
MPRAVDGLKQCSKCGETKPVSEYSNCKTRIDGLAYTCKYCAKQYRAENIEKISEQRKQYYAENKEKLKERGRQSRAKRKEQKKQYDKQYRAKNRERKRENDRKYYTENKEKILEQTKQYQAENKEKLSEKHKQYRQKVIQTEPYVYIATDRSTGCYYIGKSANIIKERIRLHKAKPIKTGLGKHMVEHNLTLNDLEIEQHHCSSVEESTALEKKLIVENIDNPLCLNKQIG